MRLSILALFSTIVVTYALLLAECSILPDDFKKCTLKSPDFEECFQGSLHTIIMMMFKGIPTINIPPMDPVIMEKVIFKGRKGSPVDLEIQFTNNTLVGLTSLKITSVKGTNIEQSTLGFEANLPKSTLNGKYQMNGKLLMINLRGKGDNYMTYDDVYIRCKLYGEKMVKDSKTYFKVKKTEADIRITKGSIMLTNILGRADPALDKQMNKVLNENFALLYAEYKKAVEDAFTKMFEPNIVKFIENVPLEDLFKM